MTVSIFVNDIPYFSLQDEPDSSKDNAPAAKLSEKKQMALRHPTLRRLAESRYAISGLDVTEASEISKSQSGKHGFRAWPINGGEEILKGAQRKRLMEDDDIRSKYLSIDKYAHAFGFVFFKTLTEKERVDLHGEFKVFFEDEILDFKRGGHLNKSRELFEFIESRVDLKVIFDKYIAKKLEEATDLEKNAHLIDRIGLTVSQHVDEMKKAQEVCRDNQDYVAYFHPYPSGECRDKLINGAAKGIAHIQTYIITPDKMIDVVPMEKHPLIGAQEFPGMYTSEVENFCCAYTEEKADGDGDMQRVRERAWFSPLSVQMCATIGLAYAKEYLKDGAYQLKNYTLAVSAKNISSDASLGKSAESFSFFLPSPHVLRYSQSELYIKILRAMVDSDNEFVTIRHKKVMYEVNTLLWMLVNGAKIEFLNGKDFSFDEMTLFRARWLKAFDQYAVAKRDLMIPVKAGDPGESGLPVDEQKNVSLLYRHLKFRGVVDEWTGAGKKKQ